MTICNGAAVDLTALVTGYASIPNPVFTEGGVTVTTPTSVKPSATTTYVLTGTTAAGCSNTANVVVTVNPRPSAGVDQLLVCSGATSPTTATLTAGSWTVLTQPSGASAAVDAAGAVTAMTLVGDYEFVLTNTSGCKDTVKVTVPPCNCTSPDLSVTGNPSAVCAPSTIDLATIAVTDASSIVNP